MASIYGDGPITWRADRDDEGFRTYRVTYRVKAAVTESPAAVMIASGLPTIGSQFSLAGYSGVDQWCWCRPEINIRIDQEKTGDPAVFYLVECVFSNKWEDGKSLRCNNTPIEDPLMEPMKVSGSFSRAQWEAKYDQNGAHLVTSANEPITGPGVTFDYVKPSVRIEQNVASLGLSTFAEMVNTVNAFPLWGVPARCVRLTNAPWERKVHGSCGFFYTRIFEFEVDYYNHDKNGNPIGFDKEVYDSGSMCLRGQWVTDKDSSDYGKYKILAGVTSTTPETVLTIPQSDFMSYKDMNNEHARVFLDGHGRPANAALVGGGTAGGPYSVVLKYHRESDFLLLGIPTDF
jgi:hypothetical protein